MFKACTVMDYTHGISYTHLTDHAVPHCRQRAYDRQHSQHDGSHVRNCSDNAQVDCLIGGIIHRTAGRIEVHGANASQKQSSQDKITLYCPLTRVLLQYRHADERK